MKTGWRTDEAVVASRAALFERIATDGFNATADMPMIAYYKELIELYPAALVVMTEHPTGSAERWAASVKATIGRNEELFQQPPFAFISMMRGFLRMETWNWQAQGAPPRRTSPGAPPAIDAAELVAFYRAERSAIIVKPCRGVGSEDVYKCRDEEACAKAFASLKATTRYAGGPNDVILAQQFLEGPEYAIDSVSRNGEHKVTAVWRYDKVGFVYQCTRLVPVDGATRPIIDSLIEALDAAGHANGPAHSELIVVDEVPTPVEINARFHNANVRPLVDRCVAGPNAIALAAAACVPDGREWEATASTPTMMEDGLLFHISCLQSGVLSGIDADALSTLENLPTLVEMEVYESFREGEEVSATTDIKTDVGWVLLAGTADDVERDYAACLEAQARLLKYR